MADLQKTIEIIFAGENRMSTSVQSVANDLSSLESAVGGLTGPLANLSASILTTEASILAAGAAMAAVAINEAGQFGDSVNEIGTLFNATTDQVDALSGQILTFSRDSVNSIDAINGAVYQAISTGTDWTEAVQLAAEAEKLATAGRADLIEVTKLLTGSLNAYGASTQDAADFSDALFVAVQKGQTTIPELASSLTQVTGIASAAEVPFSDLVAALAALTVTQGSTAESSTKLKALLSELLDPSDELITALGGVTLAGNGLDGVMAKLLQVTGGSAEEMVKLFGSVEAVQAALALANDAAGTYEGALAAMETRAGTVSKAVEAMAANLQNINQTLLNNIKVTLIEFGGPLLDGYKDVAQQLGNLFENLSPSVNKDVFAPLYAAFDEASGELTAFLKKVADALPLALAGVNFDALLDALGDLRKSISGVFDGLDLTKPEDLQKVIQFLVDGFTSLTKVSAGIVDGLKPFIQLLGDLIEEINKTEGGTKAFVGQILGFAQGLDNSLVPALGFAGDALNSIANVVLTLAGAKYLGAAVIGFGALGTAAGAAAIILGSEVYDALNSLNDKIETNRQSWANWNQAMSETSTWEEAVVQAAKLGESVTHLNEEFLKAFGVTADAVAKYGSVEAALKALGNTTTEVTGTFGETVFSITRQIEEYEKLGIKYDQIVEAAYDQVAVNKLQQKSITDLAAEYSSMTEAQKAVLTAGEKAVFQAAEWAKANGEITGTTEDVVAAFKENEKSTEALAEAYKLMSLEQRAALSTEERAAYVAAVEATYSANKDATDSTKELTKAEIEAQLTAKELAEIRLEELKAVQDYQLALEELASQERLQAMEFAFELNLEALKSDTEIALGIIDTINTAIESTGQLIGDLFGFLTNDDLDFSTKWAIERQIQLENQRRQEALDLQKRLTEALIEQMEARTAALERGDGLITIQADGLEPEIEAFMWKIIEKIHIKAVGDQSQFLLGI